MLSQMSCLWRPPCSGLKRTPSLRLPPVFLFFLSSTWIGAPVVWDLLLCRLLMCVAVTNSCIIGCLFTSLVSLSSLRLWRNHPAAAVKCICRVEQNSRMPENAFAWCCIMSMGGTNLYIDAYTNSRHFKNWRSASPIVGVTRSSSHAADVFCCVLALMHVCCSAHTRLFNKGITTPPALVFLFDPCTFQLITGDGHAVGNKVNFDFSSSYIHLFQVGKSLWKQFTLL